MFGDRRREELITDYTGRCGNCHSHMDEDDKFCKRCGTPRGEGAFAPYMNSMLLLYGPPIRTEFRCPECGHTWTDRSLGNSRDKYCPKCGHEVVKVKETDY